MNTYKTIFQSLHQAKQFWLYGFLFMLFASIALAEYELVWLLPPFVIVLLPVVFSYIISNIKQLFWVMLLLLPLSTEINITPTLGFDFPDEIFMVVLTALFFVQVIHTPTSFPLAVLKHPLFLIIVLQLIWLIFNVYYSTNAIISTKYFLAKLWFIVPFVLLPQFFITKQLHFKKLALVLLLPMAFVTIQCLVRHSFLGFSFEGIKATLSPFFRNHVNYSSMLVCLTAVLWFTKKLTPANSRNYKWLNVGLILGLIALIFAYSRGAWVAMIVAAIGGFIIHKKWLLQTFFVVLLFVTIAVVALIYNNNYLRFAPNYEQTIFHSNLGEHLKSTTTLKDLSNAERFYRWIAGAKMVAEKPLMGFGANTFYSNYKNFTVQQFKTYVSDNPEKSSVHNYYLLLAIEQGIIGLLLFASFILYMLLFAQKLYHQLQNQFYKMIALAVGVILIIIACINVMNDMIETDKIGTLFWLCCGLLIVLTKKLSNEKAAIA